MKKRLKKKAAYKKYIQDIFTGYEKMISEPELDRLNFTYLQEETVLYRDDARVIHFLTRDIKKS